MKEPIEENGVLHSRRILLIICRHLCYKVKQSVQILGKYPNMNNDYMNVYESRSLSTQDLCESPEVIS